ncbi:geranylgeranylglyceryl/heptaprenylglyceryl phosphate synthase [bacterium]|nr:geranylgeranylglyceryl/heptaprenylglyceryl phosphate synthase [bacterium]
MKTTYETLMSIKKKRGAGYLVLIDPDKKEMRELVCLAKQCEASDVDGLLIGGSLLFETVFDHCVKKIKEAVSIPVILFPGNSRQVSGSADAILFMTMISGRNAHYLIGEQVISAPIVRSLNLEAIPTGYMLIESGKTTAAEFMSNSQPIPRHKPEIAVATAMAGELLGLKMLYLEAGSGADKPVPDNMIREVVKSVRIPVIVGGGIRDPQIARDKVLAGADFIVTGTVMEDMANHSMLKEFAKAVHHDVH